MYNEKFKRRLRELYMMGVSIREISRSMNVKRDTVQKILRTTQEVVPIQKPKPPPEEDLKPRRACPGCGYLVVIPCVVCGGRKSKSRKRTKWKDNFLFSIVYPILDPRPHTAEDEDAWDNEYFKKHSREIYKGDKLS